MKKAFTEAMIVARLTWFRVLMYFLIPYATTFLTLTETWSGTTYDETHWFLIVRVHVACALAGAVSLVAFIDSSASKARDAVVKERVAIRPTEVSSMSRDETKGV